MTWIYEQGRNRRWVPDVPRVKRAPPRIIKFAAVKVGDRLKAKRSINIGYYVVTDTWFDPVKGQRDPGAGEMVAVQRIGPTGELTGSKWPHSKRGLASQGYEYLGFDYMAQRKATTAGEAAGVVVSIRRGNRRIVL